MCYKGVKHAIYSVKHLAHSVCAISAKRFVGAIALIAQPIYRHIYPYAYAEPILLFKYIYREDVLLCEKC